jgi:D-sedoheptulose 7-phosphate isomerase
VGSEATHDLVARALAEHAGVAARLSAIAPQIEALIELCTEALRSGGKILLFGNGGSAAQASHIAAELVGRFTKDRDPLPVIALTTDTAALTAIANDYDYAEVFARQVRALTRSGDVVVGISTSGTSESVIDGLFAAQSAGAHAVMLTGEGSGVFRTIGVPSRDTARIQEMHLLIGHMLCEGIEARLFG